MATKKTTKATAKATTEPDIEATTEAETEAEDTRSDVEKAVDVVQESINSALAKKGVTTEISATSIAYFKDGEQLFELPFWQDIVLQSFFDENEDLDKKLIPFFKKALRTYCPDEYKKAADVILADDFGDFIFSWYYAKVGAPELGE